MICLIICRWNCSVLWIIWLLSSNFLLRDCPGRVVTAVTAVAVQERVQGGVCPADYFAGAAFGDFRLSFFEIIVGHVGMDFMRRYGFFGAWKKILCKKIKISLAI